jgi:sugar phosphate isomerase/epimerase
VYSQAVTRHPGPHPRLSLNQATTRFWPLEDVVRGCAAAGVRGVGVWRESLADAGLARARSLITDSGLTVTSLCRGGFFTAPDAAGRAAAIADNRAAIDEAAAIGAPGLVLVSGGLPAGSRDLPGAREQVADALDALVPYARAAGIRLAVEPLHPMFCADRSVVSTLRQALDLVADYPAADAGVCLDTYHVWWDPEFPHLLDRLAGRVVLYQVADWVTPLAADALLSRGHLGDGSIDFGPLTSAVFSTGYDGWVEVEIFRQDVWDAPGEQTIDRVIADFGRLVAPSLPPGPAAGPG